MLNLGLGILWALGLIVAFYVTISTIKQFSEGSRLKETATLGGIGDTLIVKMTPGAVNMKDMKFDNNDDIDHFLSHNRRSYFFGDNGRSLSVISTARLKVTESTTDSIELIITRIARGRNKKEANENAKAIEYVFHRDSNVLVFDEIFFALEGSRFRAQEVKIEIRLPKGKVIYFDKSVKYLLDDVENTSNTWDGNMISRRWKMTDKGLECIDCDGLDKDDEDASKSNGNHKIKKDKIVIDDNGIEVNGNEAQIKIDDDGIKITTPEKDIDLRNDDKKTTPKKESKEE